MKTLIFVAWVVLLADFAAASCPTGWSLEAGSPTQCMQCGSGSVNRETAVTNCIAAGGNLASIHSAAQQTFGEGCDPGLAMDVWIGLTSGSPGGNYVWNDGTNVVYRANLIDLTGAHDCFVISDVGDWDDVACSTTHRYVCSREPIMCPMLDEVAPVQIAYNTTVINTNMYCVGTLATYSCAPGYTLVPTGATKRCELTGQWSGNTPVCTAVDCGALSNPTNGQVIAPVTTFNSLATYVCNDDYVLSGIPYRMCEAAGTWNGTAPTCVEEDDTDLAVILGPILGGLALLGLLGAACLLCRPQQAPGIGQPQAAAPALPRPFPPRVPRPQGPRLQRFRFP